MQKYILILFLFIAQISLGNNDFKGSGTEESPWQISNQMDIENLCKYSEYWADYFVLTNNIYLSGSETWFRPIGNRDTLFTGDFDGKEFFISNFVYSANDKNLIGFFGCVKSAKIENVVLVAPKIEEGGFAVAGLAGEVSSSQVENCHVESAYILGYSLVGGICGQVEHTRISECSFSGYIEGWDKVGGICGYQRYGNIEKCYSTAVVVASASAGGITGEIDAESSLQNCYSSGYLKAKYSGGGLVGDVRKSKISNSYVCGVFAEEGNIGGICGNQDDMSKFTNLYWDYETTGISISTADSLNIAMAGTTDQLIQKDFFTDWEIGGVWRIRDGQTRPFFVWEDIHIANTNVEFENMINSIFCIVSGFSDKEVAKCGVLVSDNPKEIFISNPTEISKEIIKPNSYSYNENVKIENLKEGKKYFALTYCEDKSGRRYYGDLISFIGQAVSVHDDYMSNLIVSNDMLTINTNSKTQVSIYDLNGRLVYSDTIFIKKIIDISSLSSGAYFCLIQSGGDVKGFNFLK